MLAGWVVLMDYPGVEMQWCCPTGSVSMCRKKLRSWSCWSMEDTLMP